MVLLLILFFEIFSQLRFCLKDFTKSDKWLLAAVSVNGLTIGLGKN